MNDAMAHLFDLSGEVALVTGASRGLGFEIARGLASAGARVVLNARHDATLHDAVAMLTRDGLDVVAAAFDVTDDVALDQGVAAIARAHGAIDILVNNAGIQRRHPFVDFPRAQWDEVIATNLTAPYRVSQAVLPPMIERRRGKIIHVASLLAELAPHCVQVNAIAPGYFATELNRALLDDVAFDAWVKRRTPAGRWGEPREIGGLAVFLASRAADYVTGQMIMIDGGMSVAL
jgi:gluconate 5-dehydrogenase